MTAYILFNALSVGHDYNNKHLLSSFLDKIVY